MFEERSRDSPDLPSIGTSSRSAHSGSFLGLLIDCDDEASAAATCPRIDTTSRPRETRCDSNVGCVVPHHRWPPAGHATLHRTGPRAGASPASAQVRPAPTTASAHHFCCLVSSLPPPQNVVETFRLRLLKAKGFPASDVPNCEGSVRVAPGLPPPGEACCVARAGDGALWHGTRQGAVRIDNNASSLDRRQYF